ncbi:hypothetical protein BCR42DRAFT_405758 [Absidia repens]|uniref:Uncharacterized protein n=1 Tax=Absidia repens TaxID=90262 RepID=A0A1X2ITX8_9FUNG|nr:hypothetical protein BCR42DRAFT_405758 [Absidia repens]
MTNPSPHPHSYSPPRSAFQWPAPLSPRLKHHKHNATTAINTDLPLKDILETYKNDSDILRYILLAKAEEDKRQAARDMLKTEQARIQLRQLDLEYLREQSRTTRYYDKTYQQTHASTGPPFDKPAITGTSLPPPSSLAPSYVYGLAPVQQQVLARITGNHSDTQHLSTYSTHYEHQPSSPVAYPHSAHPLCPPTDLRLKGTSSSSTAAPIITTSTTNSRYNVSTSTPLISTAGAGSQHHRHRLQPPSINTSTSSNPAQTSTPISPSIGNNNDDDISASAATRHKRTRHSVSDQLDDKLSHNKVMEALKAKIQRGNGSPVSTTPTSALPYRPSFADTFHMDKRQRQLPKPIVTLNNGSSSSSTSHNGTPAGTSSTPTTTVHTASPRSAKPILPPIDTNVGRQHHHQQQQQQQQQHRPSSPVHISPTAVDATTTAAGTPSTSQVSPSDQLLAMSTHRQEGNASHSTSTSTSSSLSSSSSSSSSNGTHGHDSTTATTTATKIKLEMD